MNPEKQRIAIAEACGKAYHKPTESEVASGSYYQYEPDYLNDLNAMHEAWLSLKDYQKREFHVQLGMVIERVTKNWGKLGLLDQRGLITNATAAQRAEAFLRTINKWEDDK